MTLPEQFAVTQTGVSRRLSPEPLKVCHFTPVPPEDYSGATLHAIWLAQKLSRLNVESEFLTLSKDAGRSRQVVDGFEFHYLRRRSGKLDELALWSQLLVFFQRHREFNLVHVHSCTFIDSFASIAASMAGLASIGTIMLENWNPGGCSRMSKLLARRFVRRFDRIVAISEETHGEALRAALDPSRVVKISIGVDVDRFRPLDPEVRRHLRRRYGLPSDRPVVTFVGALCSRKNVPWLLDTWLNGPPEAERAHLLLVGDAANDPEGPRIRRDLERQMSRAACRLHWIRWVAEIEEIYGLSDVLVLPSVREGMPTVVLQAMASGLPVLTTPVSGAPELVGRDRERGWLFDFNSRDEFWQGLLALLEDKQRRQAMGQAAREWVAGQYSLDAVARSYRELYVAVVNRL